ncbi:mechanosensitive ion channel family protein [Leptolyngbya iicbica]|uniref:Mechanosensitive ion channel protein MscS n=2 Tax=Cyanophyceae TaxID=3028117 RepID=A0A4Q7E327_9CYAN|nr:mechanosensitive ion channel domain-containing protein [Leptolyngbya sp. LK]RZM75701.1 mechanosensitive ion channel protein MscS [Leptolyngbya sp. LK]
MGERRPSRQQPRRGLLNRWRLLWAGLMALVLGISIIGSVMAQPLVLNSAPIVLDGRPLFEVAPANQMTADERAEQISGDLEDLLEEDDGLNVSTEVRNKAPVILIDGSYLMTVTQNDADLNDADSPEELAPVWAEQLDQELEIAQTERSNAVLQRRLVYSLGLIALTLLAHRLIGYLWRRSLRPLLENLATSRDDGQAPPAGFNLLMSLLLSLIRFGLWLGVINYITLLFPLTRRWSYFFQRQVLEGLLAPNFQLGQTEISIFSLFVLIGILLGIVVVSGIFANFLRSRVLRLTGIDRGLQAAIAVIAKYSMIFVGTVLLLQIWGVDLSSLALIASALGVGIGIGLQNIVKDFGSGFILVFERPIQVGDFVAFGEFQGTVEHIGARSTEIKTLDQVSIIVPNSRFLEQEVINWSHRNPVSRIRLPVGVAYSSDPKDVKQVLIEASYQHPQVLSKPPPLVFFKGFGDSSLDFELLVWIADPPKQLVIKSDLYFSIEAALRQHNIEIPFPQRDLHIRSEQLPVEVLKQLRPGDRL